MKGFFFGILHRAPDGTACLSSFAAAGLNKACKKRVVTAGKGAQKNNLQS